MTAMKMSEKTITRATRLQAIADISKTGWVHRRAVFELLQAPTEYPVATSYSNLRNKGYIDIRGVKAGYASNSASAEVLITELGLQYIEDYHYELQEYGQYKPVLIADKTAKKNTKQKSLPIAPPAAEFSSTVKLAMAEVEAVAIGNEHARQCLRDIKSAIDRFKLKGVAEGLATAGSLKLVQDETDSYIRVIDSMHRDVNGILEQ